MIQPLDLINILDINEAGSYALGPGLRYCIWVQGCPFNCKGCATPEGIPIVPKQLIPISKIIQSILDKRQITGITISGGEPFLQASKLTLLLKEVLKERSELNTIIFTGFKKSNLDWPEAQTLLSYTDVLIDGLYIDRKNDGKGLRGSSNQQIHFLSNKLIDYRTQFESEPQRIEVFVKQLEATFVGIPNAQITSLNI